MSVYSGKLSIGKYASRKLVNITVNDDASGIQCIEIEMPLDQFAEALMGLAYQDCRFEIETGLVGKQREHKVLEVTMRTQGIYGDEKIVAVAKSACKQYEIDGWEADYHDALNHHRWVRNEGKRDQVYSIGFTRYVSAEEQA